MKTLAFINLKGGVGKTVSAANVAHILATVHHKRVLLVERRIMMERNGKVKDREKRRKQVERQTGAEKTAR